MTIKFKERTIKYLNRDFSTLKRDLMEFAQAHHSGSFQDFNESSPGMALLELTAYVGDVLSFYQDMQFEELRQESAQQIKNVTSFAKLLGYRPTGKSAAQGIATVFIEVPATSISGDRVPDDAYSPVLKKGSKLQGPNGVVFETLSDIHFSASLPTEGTDTTRMVAGSQFDDTTGLPTYFALRKDVPIIAGQTQVDTFTIDSFEKFKTIELNGEDVIDIISVEDSDGNSWAQVEYLPQEVVFGSSTNDGSDSAVVPYVMKLLAVPRRFIIDRDVTTNKTSLVFGSGDGMNFDDELIPNVADFALPLAGRSTFTTFSLDPQNFLKTRTLGLSPYNTTLTINYRTGGGPQTNVPEGSIRSVSQADFEFSTSLLDPAKRSDVLGSVECINKRKTEGGADAESISEIKANSSAFFAAQNRVVTREDYIARIFSMPARFGRVEKAFVRKDALNDMALDIHILTKDQDGNLAQASTNLVRNIKKFLSPYRMLTDGVNILQTDITNIRINFGVVVSPQLNRGEVVAKCLSVLRDRLHIDKMQIGQPIVLSEIAAVLQDVVGVISVYDLRVKNMFGIVDGLTYSSKNIDIQSWTQNGIIYSPENSIFELKFPNRNIVGESK